MAQTDAEGFTPERLLNAVRQAFEICQRCGLTPVMIGGMALDAYTASRATMDIDLLADFPPESLDRIRECVIASGGRLDDAADQGETRMLRFYVIGIQVDLLRAWEPEMKMLLKRAEERQCLGMALRVPALVDFIMHKLRTGRPRDLDDAIRLLVANRQSADRELLEAEVQRLHLTDEWNVVRDTVDF